jgi:hypothetical protein
VPRTVLPQLIPQEFIKTEAEKPSPNYGLSDDGLRVLNVDEFTAAELIPDSPLTFDQVGGSVALGKSALANACNYTLRLWGRLTRLLDYPQLELAEYGVENFHAFGCAWSQLYKFRNYLRWGREEKVSIFLASSSQITDVPQPARLVHQSINAPKCGPSLSGVDNR